MNLYQRYLFRQGLWPLVTTLVALTGLAVMTQSLSNIELIAEQRETTLTFLWITVLALPQILALILPVAVFIAVAISMNRLVVDSELTVGAAAGMSRRQRLTPFVRIAAYALLANLAINLFVQPLAFRELRETVYDVRTDLAASFMRAGEFIDLGADVTFYAREVSETGLMQDVFIQDGRGENARAYAAARGLISRTDRGPVMLLEDGLFSQKDAQGELTTVAFDRYEFDLTAFIDPTAVFFFKESDRFLSELLAPTRTDIVRANGAAPLYAEGHYRLSAPLYNIAFALFAAAAFLAVEHRRTGYARLIIVAGVAAMTMRIIGFGVQAAASDDPAFNAVQYAVPIFAIALAIAVLKRPDRIVRRMAGPKMEPQA